MEMEVAGIVVCHCKKRDHSNLLCYVNKYGLGYPCGPDFSYGIGSNAVGRRVFCPAVTRVALGVVHRARDWKWHVEPFSNEVAAV